MLEVLKIIAGVWAALATGIESEIAAAEARDRIALRKIERIAAPEYHRAIERAVARAPKSRARQWRAELFRICRRESWCGRYGVVRVHAIDGWVGPRAWLGAWKTGKIDPENCEGHRLADYSPVLKIAGDYAEKISTLPRGKFSARDFATRGGFGTNAARGVSVLGECVSPIALDSPANAAKVAVEKFVACGDACSCSDHVTMWVGVGAWKSRPLVSATERSRYDSIRAQCGEAEAIRYVIGEL